MKQKVEKRINTNLYKDDLEKLDLLQRWYYNLSGGKRITQSDLIRSAINYMFWDLNKGLQNNTMNAKDGIDIIEGNKPSELLS